MRLSKGDLCWVFLALCFNFLCEKAVGFHRILPEYQSVRATVVDQKYRTGYHFQPPMHWLNDPNAPLYYKGYYHLLYQYNPYGSTWGNIVWAHSYSTDLINWIPLEPAIYPSEPYDINGAWSGSATILPGNKPVILYTGVDTEDRQVQNIAFPKNSSDPLLREWVKADYNPVIMPNKFMNASAFRDPTTAWLGKDGQWRTVIGHKRHLRGIAELYRSRDLKTWTRAKHPLHSVKTTGMWECPDFFPVSLNGSKGLDLTAMYENYVKHVLKVSLDLTRYDYYTVGRYIPERDRYIPDNTSPDNRTGLRYDYGNFYASKTFFDEKKNRRILLGWANESDSVIDDVRKGWAGIMAIPRTLWLETSGRQLLQWPVEEVETLRGEKTELRNVSLSLGDLTEIHGITSEQADVEVSFSLPSLEEAEPFDPAWIDAEQVCGRKDNTVQAGIGPFGLLTLASKNIEEYTAVFFHVFKTPTKPVVLLCAGNKKSSLGKGLYEPSFGGFADVEMQDGNLSLRTLIDHSVVESFGAGGKIVITSRVYPTLAIGKDAHLYLFNNGSATVNVKKFDAWNMGRPLMN